jgi:UDP-N-acetylglucosamine/UDP-N-acetyl-alpha-D-glucosaminouronate 4-epimerase
MSRQFELCRNQLVEQPATWLVTGVAGFIGSHLLEWLLDNGQRVVGIDNFATGSRQNLEKVRDGIGNDAWRRFTFIEGDIRDLVTCRDVMPEADHVLHQAAVGPMPSLFTDPLAVHDSNVNGFLNILSAAREAKVSSFTYATTSSIYADHPVLPRVEERIGSTLSPWAVSKRVNELYAEVFAHYYGFPSIGLRYFNVFGPNQDPASPHAGVIPGWLESLREGEPAVIYGDGGSSRDFCYVANVVQANILAAFAPASARNRVYNVAVGEPVSLVSLYETLRQLLAKTDLQVGALATHEGARPGEVRHSHADINLIREQLGYEPTHDVQAGLAETIQWHLGGNSDN